MRNSNIISVQYNGTTHSAAGSGSDLASAINLEISSPGSADNGDGPGPRGVVLNSLIVVAQPGVASDAVTIKLFASDPSSGYLIADLSDTILPQASSTTARTAIKYLFPEGLVVRDLFTNLNLAVPDSQFYGDLYIQVWVNGSSNNFIRCITAAYSYV